MREKGFSLIESMMALGLLSLAVYSYYAFHSGQLKRQAHVAEREDIIDFRAALNRAFEYPPFCDCNFHGLTVDPAANSLVVPSLKIFRNGCTELVTTLAEPGGKIAFATKTRAKAIFLTSQRALDANTYLYDLIIDLEGDSGVYKPVVVPGIFIYTNGTHGGPANEIYGCQPPPQK